MMPVVIGVLVGHAGTTWSQVFVMAVLPVLFKAGRLRRLYLATVEAKRSPEYVDLAARLGVIDHHGAEHLLAYPSWAPTTFIAVRTYGMSAGSAALAFLVF